MSEIDPVDAKFYYEKGNELFEQGEYQKAIENYNKALLLNPAFSECYFNKALCYYNLKDFDTSIEEYTKALEFDPENPVIYNNRGDAYYRKQEFQKAISDYDRAIALNKEYLKAYYNRGLAYACMEDYEKAVEDFSKVISINPEFADAYHVRGLAYEYLNKFDEAINDFQKALELNPSLDEAKAHLEIAKSKKESGYSSSPGSVDMGGGAGGQPGQNQGINAVKLLTKPKMNFKDVAGMDKFKEEIREAAVYPLVKPELAKKYGKIGGGGILLYGPPGCGKTYLVKATAGECSSAFINAKISDIVDMYVGQTEKNLHNIFETARKNAPCIIFFDELEALGGRREEMTGAAQYMKMAVNQLLYEMDGLEANNANVLVIGATNAPWDVDPALRRSGRFGKTIYVPEPDLKSRYAMLKLHAKKLPLTPLIPWWFIAFATAGYASADIKAITEEAAARPWREAFKTGKERPINSLDYFFAILKKKSSLPPWYGQANKQIGKVEEKTIVDGKEHVKISESKLGPAEKEAFKDLLDVIKRKNEWWYKYPMIGFRYFSLFILLIVGIIFTIPYLFISSKVKSPEENTTTTSTPSATVSVSK
ncbi:MAG: AAA family ATPase [Candidatus Anstonellaceae archaeon]